MLTVVALGWSALRGHPNILLSPLDLEGLAQARRGVHFVSSLAIGTAVGLLIVLLTRVLQERYTWARVLHNEFRHLLGDLTGQEMLLLAAASAIGEECFFRGALLPQIAAVHPGALGACLGIVGSSLCFGLLHIGPGTHFLPWTISSLGVGALLGVLYVFTGDLFAPIATHFVVNLLNLQDIMRRRLPA
jgi:membrane protease YdiL (CAAX protease family)